MADQAWKKLNEKVKAKRVKRCAPKDTKRPSTKDELTVQRLSASVSGKSQKYTRIGPREFVPFEEEEEMTVDNIKRACEKHFLPQIGKNMLCDILAGKQGPSCKTVGQLPDIKVIHVRFIPSPSDSLSLAGADGERGTRKRKLVTEPSSYTASAFNSPPSIKVSSTPNKLLPQRGSKVVTPAPSQYPRSLSVSDMLKLGKVNKETTTTVVNIFNFDMQLLSWCKIPTTVEFCEGPFPIGTGGFRKAFKATSKHPQFSGKEWVIKHYLPEALKGIEDTGQTVEEHSRKVVQMHLLARNFALQLEDQIQKDDIKELFGNVLRYRKVSHGETEHKECVTVEEFIPGQFTKYINNTGIRCVDPSDEIGQKAECLTHFSYERSERKVMLVDIQGNKYDLFDPEIASTDLMDSDREFLYCTGNLSELAISNFLRNHKCNAFCAMLGLSPM